MNMVILEQIKDLRSRLDTLYSCLQIADKESQASQLEQRTQAADFWDDPKAAEGVLKQISSLKLWVNAFNKAKCSLFISTASFSMSSHCTFIR